MQAKLLNRYKDYSEYIEDIMNKSRDLKNIRICSFYNYKEDSIINEKVDEIEANHENSHQITIRSSETNNNKTNIALSKSQDRFLINIKSQNLQLGSKLNLQRKTTGGASNLNKINTKIVLKLEDISRLSDAQNKLSSLNIIKKKEIDKKENIEQPLIRNIESYRIGSKSVFRKEKDKEVNSA